MRPLPAPVHPACPDVTLPTSLVPADVSDGDGIDAGLAAGAVFVRRRATRIGPFRFGHVGWAFALPSGCGERAAPLWAVGAVENSSGNPLAAPGRSDFWCDVVSDPFAAMRAHRYDEYKLLTAEKARPEAALRAQRRVQAQPYILFLVNCITAVAAVLRSYGLALPSPRLYPVPNTWFDRIAAPSLALGQT